MAHGKRVINQGETPHPEAQMSAPVPETPRFLYPVLGAIAALAVVSTSLMVWGNPLWAAVGKGILSIGFMELVGHFIVGMVLVLDSMDGYTGRRTHWVVIAIIEALVLFGLVYAYVTSTPVFGV
jgi:hypothetical protein